MALGAERTEKRYEDTLVLEPLVAVAKEAAWSARGAG